ncbi:hypothetical protein IT412_03605 [Candidatus Peregrinibacteria bacterium]|nr:hypothetical protein [Candidatus Peregrinibacteria bacterium]
MAGGFDSQEMNTMSLLKMVDDCTTTDIEVFKASLPDDSRVSFEKMSEVRKLLLATLSKLDEEKMEKLRALSGLFLVGLHDVNNLLFVLQLLRNPELE